MSFQLPELIVESVIRDGLANLKNNPQLIDDIFSSLLSRYNSRKYGQKEIDKIKELVNKKQVSVVFSYHEVESQVPCFSIMIGSDDDDKRTASLGDFRKDVFEPITDPDELANLVLVDQVAIIAWDYKSGELILPLNADLSQVTRNNVLIDVNNIEYTVKSIVDTSTYKSIFIQGGEEESFEPNDLVTIRSSLNFRKYEVNGVNSDVRLVIGVHTKDALTTKYMYIMLKHMLLSRKEDLIKRLFIVSSYSGSDFTRDQAYTADKVFTRFLTLTGKVEDSWKQSEVTLIEDVQPIILVAKSSLDANPQTTESLGLGEQTIQISDDDQDPPSM